MGMADANKCIDLAAPLISLRRHGGDGTEPTATATGLPGYKADATWGPLGHTGAVPFVWEHRPGHPKSVRTRRPPPPPPLTIVVDEPTPPVARKPAAVIVASERAREEERLSDALSRDDVVSCVTVNCSATGLSDAASACAGGAAAAARSPAPAGARGGVMMDRFLPAAHAVVAGSPQNTFRKAAGIARDATRASPAARTGAGDRSSPAPRRLPVQHVEAYQYHYHLPPLPPEGEEEEDDDAAESDAHSTAGFASKRCAWLSTRCVKGALLRRRRGAGRSLLSSGGGSQKETNSLLRRSRNGQRHTGDDPGMQSWEEIYIKSLLRSDGGVGRGGLVMGPAAAVASELDRTVRELYKHRGGQAAVKPKASHLGLLLVLDRSNEDPGRGYHRSSPQKLPKTGDAALLLPPPTTGTPPNAGNQLRRDVAGDYGFPLLLEGKEAVAARETALSPLLLLEGKEAVAARETALSPPPPRLPASPTESWLSRALPSVSTRPPATSFLGLHVQSMKHAPLPWCSIDSAGNDVDHDGQRQRRLHDLQK